MTIQLKRLIPLPVKEIHHHDSEIWEAESLVFKPGERIFLYAASGKGKTSLLSIIYGIRKDYDGKLFIDGKDLKTFSLKEISTLRKQKFSYIFQGLELFDELTALENIQLKNRQTSFKTKEEINEMAETLEISGFLDRKAEILSFGQKQRVAIIRALCQPFDFLLADEIFSHLDEGLKAKSSYLIDKEIKEQGATLLFTSLSSFNDSFPFTKRYRV